MEAGRIRHRQGTVHLVDGVPYPDKASTLSLLPVSVVGRWLADNADAVRGDLLDLGAGNQPFRPWYEPISHSVVAVDVADAPGLDALSFAAPLPFRDGSFDAVLSTSVFEHVDDIDAAVAEVARTLRPGGRFVITMPFLYPTHEAPYDFWRTTHFGLRSLLERHGFEVTEISAQGGPFLLLSHYLLGGLAQVISLLGSKLGKLGLVVDNRVIRALIAAPQEAVRSRLSYRSTRLSRAASLGYMTVARKPL
jgi:SAM-dependent methyltransferase